MRVNKNVQNMHRAHTEQTHDDVCVFVCEREPLWLCLAAVARDDAEQLRVQVLGLDTAQSDTEEGQTEGERERKIGPGS